MVQNIETLISGCVLLKLLPSPTTLTVAYGIQ
jgi:hypothetical protein